MTPRSHRLFGDRFACNRSLVHAIPHFVTVVRGMERNVSPSGRALSTTHLRLFVGFVLLIVLFSCWYLTGMVAISEQSSWSIFRRSPFPFTSDGFFRPNHAFPRETKFAFVHIPKNAGSSVKRTIISSKLPIKVCGHDATTTCVGNRQVIVVVRDPVTRFMSAVKYAQAVFADRPSVASVRAIGLKTANDWAEALCGERGEDAKSRVGAQVLNVGMKTAHRVGGRMTKYKWTYVQQAAWIALHPSPVLLRFDRLNDDWLTFLRANGLGDHPIGHRVTYMAKANRTPTKGDASDFSPCAMSYLSRVYRRDFALWGLLL